MIEWFTSKSTTTSRRKVCGCCLVCSPLFSIFNWSYLRFKNCVAFTNLRWNIHKNQIENWTSHDLVMVVGSAPCLLIRVYWIHRFFQLCFSIEWFTNKPTTTSRRYVKGMWVLFGLFSLVLYLLLNRFTFWKLCCICKSTMKCSQKPNWKSVFPLFNYDCWKCAMFIEYIGSFNHCNLPSDFSSKFQSFMTTFHQKLLTREGRILANGWTHPSSMTIFDHLFIKIVIWKVSIVT